MTFDARVNTILHPESLDQVRLELRVQEILLQAICLEDVIGKSDWDKTKKLTPESIVTVTGQIHLAPSSLEKNRNKFNTNGHGTSTNTAYSISVTKLVVIAQALPDLPQSHTRELTAERLEDRLDNRILDVRNGAAGAIFKLHSGMCQLIVEFLCSNGFHWIHTPRIINATIAGDNEFFHLPYFGRDAWLAQSSQHHKQMALSMDIQRVFEIGPVFRAEVKSSASARHMTEVCICPSLSRSCLISIWHHL